MAETRTITIESPPENILSVQVEAGLVDRFVHTATDKGGPWRSKKETFQHALESAVAVALTKFLEGTIKHEATP
ncbi:hypothetical protein ES703_56957 [subsurface metagenome]